MREIIWVLDYWNDIDADFLRFYRIDLSEVDPVDPPRFFALAHRLPAYEGVLAARIQQEAEDSKKRSPAKALRDNPQATVVDNISALGDIVDVKN